MAGAMWVTFCITAPARPTAPPLKGVSATQASPGFSTTSSARWRAYVSVIVISSQALPRPGDRFRFPTLAAPANVLCTGTFDISTLGKEACQLGVSGAGGGRGGLS